MANFLTRIFNPALPSTILQEAENAHEMIQRAQAGIMDSQEVKIGQLEESMRDLSLWLEDRNWIPVDGWEEEKGFSLDTIKTESDRIRALSIVNPLIKKAINMRAGYVWGNGVSFKGAGIDRILKNPRNQSIMFDPAVAWKLESQLSTDGNIWAITSTRGEEIIMLPIHQLAGWVVDENDPTRVLYWLRRYSVQVKNFSNGVEETKFIEVFYPASDNTNTTAKQIDGIAIDRTRSVVHIAANRQEGWVLGIPDIMAAMFWSQAHKELFEAGVSYVKAQGKFASKVIAKTGTGANAAAARIADMPRKDPATGEVLDAGGTAVLGGGLDLQLMGKMSGGVDFDKFNPVAGLIAAALGVPLAALIGEAPSEEVALEATTVEEMKMRQRLWSQFFKGVFGRGDKVEIIWPKIKSEPTYRQIQSVELSNRSGTLTREELRQLTLEAYGIDGNPDELPDLEENAFYLFQKMLADNAAEHAAEAADAAAENAEKLAATAPEQGVDAKVGKLSTGGDAKDSRNNKSDKNTKNE